jgi:flagellar hook assembly protein FlgD
VISGEALAIALAAALTWFTVSEAVKGVKWVGHHVASAVHKIVHPHEVKK